MVGSVRLCTGMCASAPAVRHESDYVAVGVAHWDSARLFGLRTDCLALQQGRQGRAGYFRLPSAAGEMR